MNRLTTPYMPKGVFSRNIEFSGMPGQVMRKLMRVIVDPEFIYETKHLHYFLETVIPILLKNVKVLLGT